MYKYIYIIIYIYIYRGWGGGEAGNIFPSSPHQPSGIKFYPLSLNIILHSRPKRGESPWGTVPASNIVIPKYDMEEGDEENVVKEIFS